MFGFRKSVQVDVLQKDIKFLQDVIKGLKKDKSEAVEALEELRLKKRLEQEEITHMQKINSERMKQEVETKKIELTKKYTEDIAKFKEEQRVELVNSLKDFHTKIEARFNSELENLKETYKAIMARLPNVNLTLTKKV